LLAPPRPAKLMFKLSLFPRGNNRNRPLKRLPAADLEYPQEVDRLFRRFWRERRLGPRPAEEGRPCA